MALPLLVAVEAGMVAAFHAAGMGGRFVVGWSDPGTWLAAAAPTDAVVALARTAGLGLSWYLLVTTLLYAWAHRVGWHGVTRVLRRATFPVVRKAVEGVAAVSLMVSTVAAPAVLIATPAFAQEAPIGVDDSQSQGNAVEPAQVGDTVGVGYSPEAAGWPGATDDFGFWAAEMDAGEAVSEYTVVRGDHFWSIAHAHLAAELGRDVTEDEVCAYWSRLVEANRASIRSGDPNLIFPGEVITLVPVFADAPVN